MARKSLLVSITLLATFWPLEVLAHCHVPNRCPVSFVACWNSQDAQCVADYFEENADLYEPFGSYVSGRQNILQMLRTRLASNKLGKLVLNSEPLTERSFKTNQALINWYAWTSTPVAGKESGGTCLLLTAWLVPTNVSPTGEIGRHSFRMLRMIPVESGCEPPRSEPATKK